MGNVTSGQSETDGTHIIVQAQEAVGPHEVTLAKDTIHNPAEPRHFMKIKPINKRIRIIRNGVVLAETQNAVRLQEVGHDMYDPALYLPRDALKANFSRSEKTSHCPLKGDANYLNLADADGEIIDENLVWTYQNPLNFVPQLKDLVSFYTDRVTVEEAPL